jgi:hypothetical protein
MDHCVSNELQQMDGWMDHVSMMMMLDMMMMDVRWMLDMMRMNVRYDDDVDDRDDD